MNLPKISIITITYNSENTVRETFESVMNQNYPNLEYIIIDGGSKDSTLEIAKEYQSVISRIISEPDEGISDAMNKGIRAASGELIGIIHSDDMLAHDALSILSKSWDEETDVFYGDLLVCNERGTIIHKLTAKSDLRRMPYYVEMSHPSTFIAKKAYDKYGLYDLKYKCAMDNDLLIRFNMNGAKFKYIPSPLAVYRVGGTNMRMREKTIKESRDISIKYGGGKTKSYAIWIIKKAKDKVRPILERYHISSSRVKNGNE